MIILNLIKIERSNHLDSELPIENSSLNLIIVLKFIESNKRMIILKCVLMGDSFVKNSIEYLLLNLNAVVRVIKNKFGSLVNIRINIGIKKKRIMIESVMVEEFGDKGD